MRYYIHLIAILAISLLASCGKNGNDGFNKSIVLGDIKDGDQLIDAIDSITSNTNLWTQERYDTLRTKINSLYAAQVIESDATMLEYLYVQSVGCLKNRVDEEFKKPRYTNYPQLKSDLAFLKKDNDILYDEGVTKANPDPRLEKVQDIFTNYENVLNMSKYTFAQKAKIMQPYSGDYTSTKRAIENNVYYDEYFSKNSDITNGVKEFPSRLAASKSKYYNDLEELVEEEIVEQKMTKIECLKMFSEFEKKAKGQCPDSTITKLRNFVSNYNEQ